MLNPWKLVWWSHPHLNHQKATCKTKSNPWSQPSRHLESNYYICTHTHAQVTTQARLIENLLLISIHTFNAIILNISTTCNTKKQRSVAQSRVYKHKKQEVIYPKPEKRFQHEKMNKRILTQPFLYKENVFGHAKNLN